jgi:hypothetical protein
VLGNCVHGRGDKGRLEGDALRDWGVEGDIGGREAYSEVRMAYSMYGKPAGIAQKVSRIYSVAFYSA